jgi:ubiquinone/menaquinone biosynthesis C-methylase UbiE
MQERIEILSVDLLDKERQTVDELKRLARSLGLEFGWHYLLDLAWIISQLGSPTGKRIMDAGAGTGVMQWYLAERGAEVLSVDRASRADLPLRFRRRFRADGLRAQDLLPASQAFKKKMLGSDKLRAKIASQARDLADLTQASRTAGKVTIYNQDLKSLTDIPDDSLEAVVAVSALEHNTPQDLELVVEELLRVLKPGGVLLATLGAAQSQDWFHEPSQGWCYSEASLRRCFKLPAGTPSNYDQYTELFAALVGCAELRDDLASFYYRSGDNGMPWGIWDPQYQPVGVLKVK